jgi:hypothetical protein
LYTNLNPVLNAAVTNAQGVNNNGLVAGFYSIDGVHQHGFLYNPTTAQFNLLADPVIPNLVLTQFLGINDHGLAVGYYQLPDGSQHGFLFDTTTDSYSFLDDPNAALSGVSITQITGVNNAGEIAGFYVDGTTGLQRGFLATPAAAAPEPGTVGLVFAVVAAIGFKLRKRQWQARRPALRSVALLVFFAAPAGAGIVASDLGAGIGLLRRSGLATDEL